MKQQPTEAITVNVLNKLDKYKVGKYVHTKGEQNDPKMTSSIFP